MELLFAGVGLALLITAAVGRQVKLAGNEIPAPETTGARAATGILGIACIVAALLISGRIDLTGAGGPGASASPSALAVTAAPASVPPSDVPSAAATPATVASVEPSSLAVSQLQPCVAPAGPSTFPRLTNADPTITAGSRLCLLGADMYTSGIGEGLVRVVAGTTELIRFDMRDFDITGEEGAGSGERRIDFLPAVGVPPGTIIRLDIAGCQGEACTALEIVFSAGVDAG